MANKDKTNKPYVKPEPVSIKPIKHSGSMPYRDKNYTIKDSETEKSETEKK